MNDENRALRDRIVLCAMAYVFGDYPGTDNLATKGEALAALEEACMDLEAIERKRESTR